eukprot:402764_1
MPTRRVSKKQVTLEADYGHIYSVYGITSDTFKTHTKMLSWVTNTGWFQEDWLRIKNTNNPASKGTKMGAKDTAHHIEAKENDPNNADYEVNEWSQLYDHKNRLPRSAGQLKELGHKNALKTVWYIRKDIFKHLNKLKSSESKSTELESCVLKLKKFGVCKWFKSYVCTFFPGRLDEARGFGLLQDDEEQNGLLHKEEEEQKDDKNWLDFL